MIFRNSVANFLGNLIFPAISILLVPFYIRYLGLEGYGLVGFFSMLVTLLGIFTKGLGSALQREFSRRNGSPGFRSTMQRLLRTFEVTYWVIGFGLGAGLVLFSGFVSTNWLNLDSISTETVRICLVLISVSIAVTFPNSVYQAVFVGTQRQVAGNTLNSASAIVQALIAAVVVWLWQSVVGFYMVGVIVAILQLLMARHLVYKFVRVHDPSEQVGFDWSELKGLWEISYELIWTNGIGLIITQLDRVSISRLLPVASLGIYNVGVAGGRLLDNFYAPFLTATYPQTCELALSEDRSELGRHLVRNAKVMMIVCLTVGLPFSFFAPEIIAIWTSNEQVVPIGSAVLSVYALASILLYYASVFYQGLMALGKTRYGVWFSGAAIIWYPLAMWFLVGWQGLVGAAWAWLLYCFLALIFNASIVLGKVIKQNYWRTYLKAIVSTALAGTGLVLISRYAADILYADWIWGRVMIAGFSAIMIAVVSYLLCFSFTIPDELKAFLRPML